jgi:hypothetical protein
MGKYFWRKSKLNRKIIEEKNIYNCEVLQYNTDNTQFQNYNNCN